MKTTGWLRSVLGLGALLVGCSAISAAPAPGNPGTLKEVPANAALVVHLRGLEGTVDRFFHLAKQVVGDKIGHAEEFVKEFRKNGHDGRKLRGLAKNGPVFLVFTEMPQLSPNFFEKMAIIAAVTNYRDFLDNILKEDERKALKAVGGYETTQVESGTAYFIDRKDYIAITMNEDVAKALVKKGAGLNGKISQELGARLLASDFGIYLSMDMVNKEYAEQIKRGKEMAEESIKTAIEDAGKNEKAPLKSQLEMVQKMIGPAFQAVEDSQGLLWGIEFRPAGLAAHMQTELRASSPTSKVLKECRASSFKALEGLPSGQMFYTGMQISPVLFQTLGGFMYGAIGTTDEATGKSLKAALEELQKANPRMLIGSASVPPVGLQVWTYDDPTKALAAQVKIIESMTTGSTFVTGMLKGKPIIKAGAQKYGGFEFTEVKLAWDVEKMVAQGGAELPEQAKKQMAEAFKKLLGEGSNVWYGTDGKHVLQVTAKDWAGAEKLLESYSKHESMVGGQGNFKDVRKELPGEASVLMMVDMVKYATAILDFVKPMLSDKGILPKDYPPPAPKGTHSFVGGTVILQEERAAIDKFVSAKALKDGYETFIKPFFP